MESGPTGSAFFGGPRGLVSGHLAEAESEDLTDSRVSSAGVGQSPEIVIDESVACDVL
jgi:hypothetical protein